MKRLTTIVCFIISFQVAFTQSNYVDSLKQQLEKVKVDTARLNTISRLGFYYQDSKPDSLLFYARLLLDEANRYKNQKMITVAYSSFGQYEYVVGNYSLALQWLFKSLQLSENINDSNRIANSHNLIGNAYKEYGDYERAIPHYLMCKKIAELSHDNKQNDLFACMNLGEIYALIGKPDSGLVYTQQAYTLALKYKSRFIGGVLMSFGFEHYLLDNRNLSLEYLKQGLNSYYNNFGDSRYLSKGYITMAAVFRKYRQIDSAIYYAHVALNVARVVPYLKGIGVSAKFLSAVYDSLHIIDSAFFYQKMFISINDSLNDRAKIASFENETFLERVRQQEKQQALQKAKEERRLDLQYAFIAIGIIAFVILFLLLSHSVIVNEKIISFFGVLGLLVAFEFIYLLIHPTLATFTHESPVLMLLILVLIASLLIPLHHRLEKWIKEKMIEKNKRIRLEAAKKTIEKLEKKVDNS